MLKSKINFVSFKSIPTSYKILGVVCSVAVTFFGVYLFVLAGNIDSPGVPASTGRMYTLEQIYQKLYSGTVTAKQSVFTEPGSAPGSTMHTLDNIYGDFTTDATASNGTTAADVRSGKTFFATSGTTRGTSWGPVAGTLANCSEGGNACYASSGYWTATAGSAVNVINSSGTAITAGYYSGTPKCTAALTGGTGLAVAAGQMLSGYSAYASNGAAINGSVTAQSSNVTVTGSIGNAITAGYYSGTPMCVAGLTGGTGTLAAAGQILSTYHAWDSTGNVLQGSIATQTLDPANGTVNAGYYAATTLHAVDADLAVGNIKKDTVIFGFTGTLAPDGIAAATDCLDTKTFYSGNSWVQKTGNIANCSEGGNACYASSGYWTATAGSAVNVINSSGTAITAGYYSGTPKCTAALTGGSGTILTDGSEIISGYSAYGANGTPLNGSYVPTTTTYNWTKNEVVSPSWVGINRNLDWAKEIGAANYWSASTTYTYCCNNTTCSVSHADCTTTKDGATSMAAAVYTGPPGGWNGAVIATFDQSALHAYAVVGATNTITACTASQGDLVFPDGSVWAKAGANPYSTTETGCGPNAGGSTWTQAEGSGKQYGYARNAPSALSIADAWDGIKDLVSGPLNTHVFTNTGKMDDYYDTCDYMSTSCSWYTNGGTSRMPTIDEYERARKGTSSSVASLLYGTGAWTNSLYLWSAEPYPNGTNHARNFNPSFGTARYDSVEYQTYPLWVVVAQ